MKKTILITLLSALAIAIPAVLFISNRPRSILFMFTAIDVVIILILLFSILSERRNQRSEKLNNLRKEREYDKMLSICKDVTELNKGIVSQELECELKKGDANFVENWARIEIPKFINKFIFPVIQKEIPGKTYEILNLADEMNMIVFKIAFENINKHNIPEELLRQFDQPEN